MNLESTTEIPQTSEVARRFGVSPITVHLRERTGRLPALKTATGVRLFHRADVERFARERQATELLQVSVSDGLRLADGDLHARLGILPERWPAAHRVKTRESR